MSKTEEEFVSINMRHSLVGSALASKLFGSRCLWFDSLAAVAAAGNLSKNCVIFSPLKCFSGHLFLPFSLFVSSNLFCIGQFTYDWSDQNQHQRACLGCARVCASECGCARVCAGVSGWAWVCVQHAQVCIGIGGCGLVRGGCGQVRVGVCGYGWVWADVGGCAWVCKCVWDEFSEFLPENRVPTSADFNTYPIQIFLYR